MRLILCVILLTKFMNADVFKFKSNYYSVNYYCYNGTMEISIYKVEPIADNNIVENYYMGYHNECVIIKDQSRPIITIIKTDLNKLALDLIKKNYKNWEN